MSFSVGSLVAARGREWVVLPESTEEFVIVRPLGGTDAEIAGIDTNLEEVRPATFDLPNSERLGDFESCRLLRDAVRLGFRSSAGPFRSFGKIAVQPRPYQLVPLMMALRLDPIRMLIADDVGIGKTVEALLIAREMLDRGETNKLCVLCPPHLAEQWRDELEQKFHISAKLVLPTTANKLDRECGSRSVFDVFDYTVVSLDYIKSDSRRDDFVRACPDFVIIDEAHTCTALGQPGRGARKQQRHQLVKELAKKLERNMILVTATPHSGNEQGWRSLLSLLNPDFDHLPEDLSGDSNRKHREAVARHLVLRRRADIREYLKTDTAFPERLEKEESYELGKSDYRQLFEKFLDYASEVVQKSEGMSAVRQRVCGWAVLALLRTMASSPAAAATSLRSKLKAISTDNPEEVDHIGGALVFDEDSDESDEAPDWTPGTDFTELDDDSDDAARERRKLMEMAREAEQLYGDGDPKLLQALKIIKKLLKDGHRPIVFCRFIATAEYIADQLRQRLPKKVTTIAVTSKLGPEAREARVNELLDHDSCVLVCTDCLSEGINLQHIFDSVIHYDLSWNPTRHEQREGRVDRFGQPKEEVKVVTYYGTDNYIDGAVLDVLIEKHQRIRRATGISIPIPKSKSDVMKAVLNAIIRRDRNSEQQRFDFMDEDIRETSEEIDQEWQNVADREKKSRSLFAQHSINPDEVAEEVDEIGKAIGTSTDVKNFVMTMIRRYGGTAEERNGSVRVDLSETKQAIREVVDYDERFTARFEPNPRHDEIYLPRTHQIVDGLATYTMDTALDDEAHDDGPVVAARCGVIRTSAVKTRTTLLLVRFRYHIVTETKTETRPLLAEDCQLVGFEGAPDSPTWLTIEQSEALLDAVPEENVADDVARGFVQKIVGTAADEASREAFKQQLEPYLSSIAEARGKELLDAHQRVRRAAKRTHVKHTIEPQTPPDVLGVFVYLPVI